MIWQSNDTYDIKFISITLTPCLYTLVPENLKVKALPRCCFAQGVFPLQNMYMYHHILWLVCQINFHTLRASRSTFNKHTFTDAQVFQLPTIFPELTPHEHTQTCTNTHKHVQIKKHTYTHTRWVHRIADHTQQVSPVKRVKINPQRLFCHKHSIFFFKIWECLLRKINHNKRSNKQWDRKTQSSQLSSSPDT